MRFCTLHLFILALSSAILAQNNELDSLELLLQTEMDDSSKFEIYQRVIWPYTRSDSDRAILLTDDLKALGEELENDKMIMTALYYYGTSYKNMGRSQESLSYFKEYYDYYLEKKDTARIANVLFQLGAVQSNNGNYPAALDYYNQCIAFDEYLGRRKSMAATIGARAILYRALNQLDRSIKDHQTALQIFEEEGDQHQAANCHLNIGNIYNQRDEYELALNKYEEAYLISKEINYIYLLGHISDGRGGIYEKQGLFDRALDEYKNSLFIREELGHIRHLVITKIRIAELYNKTSRQQQAIEVAKEALEKSLEQSLIKEQENSYKVLSDAYKKSGNYEQALAYHEKYSTVKDSVLNQNISKQFAEMDAKFETSRKEAEINRLSYESDVQSMKLTQQKWALIFAAIVVAILGFLFRNIFKKSQEIEEQKNVIQKSLKEKDFLLKEIHHRVKNNLQVISSLLKLQSQSVDDEKAQSALNEGRNRVRSMAIIHQNLYQEEAMSSIDMEDYLSQLSQELLDTYQVGQGNVQLQLDIEKIRLDVDSTVPIGLIVNELISNSLKYGFPEERGGVISIKLQFRDEHLYLEVSDDGIGFDQEKSKKNSFGHLMIEAFAERLQAEYHLDGSKGTFASFLIRDFTRVAA